MPQPSTEQESFNGNALLTQLTTGPSIREVASTILRPALKELYPELDIDPDLAIVVSPNWLIVDDQVIPDAPHHESLTGALARHAVTNAPLIYIDGEHYLTYRTAFGPDRHLPVRIDAIARLINACAPLLFVAYQEQQLDFWNATNGPRGTRWQAFASALRNAWDIKPSVGWGDDECAMARNVFLYPDYALRLPNDPYRTRAYLMDVDIGEGSQSEHLSLASLAILIGTQDQHTMILTYSIATGYEQFDSLEALGQALRLNTLNLQDETLQWRLFEPEGDFFEYQACTLISLQIEAIGQIGLAYTSEQGENGNVERQRLEFGQLSSADRDKLVKIGNAIPDWLKDAGSADLSSYSRAMFDLATLNSRTANKTYQDDIPPIGDYALQAMADAMMTTLSKTQKTDLGLQEDARIKQQLTLKLGQVRITVTSQVVLGLFTAPGLTSTATFSLAELALENLIALPLGNKVAHHKDGRSLPTWMSVMYLQDLITQVNVGEQYPRLVKNTLLDDPVQSLRRQTLYTDQLRLQLPLLALQYKIRKQYGVDEQGYRYVCAAMASDPNQRRVNGQTVVIRPLAFIPKRRTPQTADPVGNMFVIGPQNPAGGPCLLYRPLFSTPLMQFPAPDNLIYAIKQSTALRQSVLAWLPDSVRSDYAQFVFPGSLPSPWLVSELLVDPSVALTMSGPVMLADQTLHEDDLATLFKSNAKALVDLADKQSVSNAEARWESFKHAGWLIFNAALPFLGKTVGTAAWIAQVLNDVQAAIDASENGDSDTQWSALTDIFLNLGMALALHLARRQSPPLREEKTVTGQPETLIPPPIKKPTVRLPDIPAHELPAGHDLSLHTLGARTRKPASLKKTLDSFSVARPDALGAQHALPDPHQHLYPLDDQWYAPVGERWFKVRLDENDTVVIVDPTQPSRLGPVLVNNRAGQWFVDTRLRLRGAGFRSRMKKGQKLRPVTVAGLREELADFDRQESQACVALEAARSVSRAAPPETADKALETFIATLTKRRDEYDTSIAKLKSLNLIDVVPDYPKRMLSYLKQQVLIAQAGIDEQLTDFKKGLEAAGQNVDTGADDVLANRHMADKTGSMITQLEYVHSRFKYLRELGDEGAQFELKTRKDLPTFGLDDLKALRVSLSRHLCFQESSADTPAETRNSVNEIIDAADLTIQSTRQLLEAQARPGLDEQIEALNDLTDQYTVINQKLLDLPGEYPGQILRAQVEDVRKQINVYARETERHLNLALRERKAQSDRAEASTSAAAAVPKKKIIKTRFKGVVVGEPREKEPDLVDVKAPLTNKVIATFHEKKPGVWVQRQPVTPHVSRPPTVSLATSLRNAGVLLDDVDGFIERTTGLAGEAQRLPVEIEEKFERRAQTLEQAGQTVEHAANATNETDNTASQAVIRKLDDAVKKLYREGRRVRLDMLKKRPPTAAHVELLATEGELTIQAAGSRRRLKGPRKDFLQEYEVRDQKTNKVLWYAHFHYPALDAPNETYTAAHLKTLEQRRLGGAFEEYDDMSEQLRIAIYRAKIGPHLARTLFLSKAPASAT